MKIPKEVQAKIEERNRLNKELEDWFSKIIKEENFESEYVLDKTTTKLQKSENKDIIKVFLPYALWIIMIAVIETLLLHIPESIISIIFSLLKIYPLNMFMGFIDICCIGSVMILLISRACINAIWE